MDIDSQRLLMNQKKKFLVCRNKSTLPRTNYTEIIHGTAKIRGRSGNRTQDHLYIRLANMLKRYYTTKPIAPRLDRKDLPIVEEQKENVIYVVQMLTAARGKEFICVGGLC